MATTAIKPCNCTSTYQDRRYGKGNRVHNEAPKKNGGSYNCTVCGKNRK